jgi:hypothetical protein
MANDSSLLPETPNPPGQATLYTAEKTTVVPSVPPTTITTTDIEFDYSSHLDRVVTALEQLSLSIAFIADKIDNISDKISNVSSNSDIVTSLAGGEGIHMKGPLDWLGLVSTYKLYVENVGPENVTLQGLIAYKAKIDALPKEF